MPSKVKKGHVQGITSTPCPSTGTLPGPMEGVRNTGINRLLKLLANMFDQADDTLFQMADRAGTNSEQDHFFESMREIRVKRRGMESSFKRQIDHYFTILPTLTDEDAKPRGLEEVSVESLSLVQNDELEESVAIDSMVSKARNNCAAELFTLNTRLDSLLPLLLLTPHINPLDPRQICLAFAEASRVIELDIKAKLILFKLFDKKVLVNLGDILVELNQFLIAEGVLTKLSYNKTYPEGHGQENHAQKNQGLPKPSLTKPSLTKPDLKASRANYSGENNGQPETATLSELNLPVHLRQIFQDQHIPYVNGAHDGDLFCQTSLSQSTSSRSRTNKGARSSQVLPHPQLMSLLSELQYNFTAEETNAHFDIREAVEEQLNSKLTLVGTIDDKKVTVDERDDEAINLVSMLFEFILDDRNLSESVRASIARLQIPVVKVALSDKQFFACASHPLRRLLNQLAQSAIGLNDKAEHTRDKRQEKIHDIVQRVLTEFDSNVELFEELLEEFNHFIKIEDSRSRLIEQRICDAEKGKAKTELARAEVGVVIQEKLKGLELSPTIMLSPTIIKVLQGPWSNYLFLLLLKQGKGGREWNRAIKTVDDLLWSLQPKQGATERQKLMVTAPDLLKALRDGLSIVSYSPFEMSKLFDELEAIHLASARGDAPTYQKSEQLENPEEALLVQLADDLERLSEECHDDCKPVSSHQEAAALCLELEGLELEGLEPTTDNPHKVLIDSDAVKEAENIEEIELGVSANKCGGVKAGYSVSDGSVIESSVIDNSVSGHYASDYSGYIEHVHALEVGAWVEFKAEDNSKIRCKLAANIKAADKFIFVNRSGVKVVEKNTLELCVALQHGTVKFLDDALLFDRALESVIGTLRQTDPRRAMR